MSNYPFKASSDDNSEGGEFQKSRTPAGEYGVRTSGLVEIASSHGVPKPTSCDDIPVPMPDLEQPLPFIENKAYDHSRIADFLSLSVARNHHANGGPVAALLEKVVAAIVGLPDSREVVAVSNGTLALHLAAAAHSPDGTPLRWVASAFNFFSCGVGPLSNTRIIDCDENGRFDLDRLKSLPEDSYDGVIYTNVFAQQSDWDAVADFCASRGKAFIVDNATGLLDRPRSALSSDGPIETISAHHTKPWGVGEGGLVICDKTQAARIRALANFGWSHDENWNGLANNAKISDLAASAILDRLEKMEFWAALYHAQDGRMREIVADANCGAAPFSVKVPIHSPRTHTPFLATNPVDVFAERAAGPVILRKYYLPMKTNHPANEPAPMAESLFARIFCLSNAPEMSLIPSAKIADQVRRLCE
ncbi:dTDP-4-amino-4,6-dideoxygalactose transaminase [Shimia isoporae]|uniref:dTDP-4-amino-4,6-dideoxygalactose transaminase n=1 Tax=Shimia isoporae TaxID=647720 RepID=A0A4R1N9I3_9RHOB|nr:DegT/DnrJ/EryC1/StrS family aminotransferase [Shimia isoporae]TCK99774.1 dTDP-4-amino-4,6-dideoxygalactose transaminase [Shimia isoporae]